MLTMLLLQFITTQMALATIQDMIMLHSLYIINASSSESSEIPGYATGMPEERTLWVT